MNYNTDYGRPVMKSPSLQDQKSTPTPKFLGMAEAYLVCHINPNIQISLIYAFIGCPSSVNYSIVHSVQIFLVFFIWKKTRFY